MNNSQDLFKDLAVNAAHKNQWEIAETVFGIPFLVGIALQFIFPVSLFAGIWRVIFAVAGAILAITGIWLVVLARREFAHFAQPTDPGQPTSKIIKTGVFAISRNPLYLGGILVLLGIALSFHLLWSMLALLLSIVLCHYVLILPEERYLITKFGEEYKDYMASVPRWLGRK